MRKLGAQASVLVWACLAAGCAKAPSTPAKTPAPLTVVPPAGDTAASAPSPDDAGRASAGDVDVATKLEEAPTPGDLVALLRARDPRRTISTIGAEIGLPTDLLDVALQKTATEFARETLREQVDAEAFGALIDWSAPFDVAVVAQGNDPTSLKGASAFSFGVTSLQRALAAMTGKVKQRPEGFWQLDATDGHGSLSCGLFASAGRAPARVVCGDHLRDVVALGPYLTTTFAKRDVGGGELHAEVRLRPLLDKFGPELALKAQALPLLAATQKIGVPAFDRALLDAAAGLSEEVGHLTHDLDSFDLDAGLDAVQGVRVTAKASFSGQESWTVKRMLDAPATIQGAPEVFGRAPRSSASAAYAYGGDPSAYEGMFRVARGLVEGKLEHLKFAGAADRKAIADLLRVGTAKYVPTMSAHGRFVSADGASAMGTLQGVVSGALGWYVVGVDDESKGVTSWLNDLVKVYNRPALQAWMKGELKGDAKFLPTLKVVPAPASLGAGALDVELKVANLDDPMAAIGLLAGGSKTAAPKVAVSVHVLVMPDGNRTYVGISADRDSLAALLLASKGKVAGPETLATLSELDAFRREPHRSGAFFTLKGTLEIFELLKPYLAFAPSNVSGPLAKLFTAMKQLPHGGTTPITVTTDVTRGPKPTVSLQYTVPQATLDDVGYLVKIAADEFKQMQAAGAASPTP